jgi:hypothetical protein
MAQKSRNSISGNLCRTEGSQSVYICVICGKKNSCLGTADCTDENGRLVEEGTGEALLDRDGLFARLYRIQEESMGWTLGGLNHTAV